MSERTYRPLDRYGVIPTYVVTLVTKQVPDRSGTAQPDRTYTYEYATSRGALAAVEAVTHMHHAEAGSSRYVISVNAEVKS